MIKHFLCGNYGLDAGYVCLSDIIKIMIVVAIAGLIILIVQKIRSNKNEK